MKRAVFLDRDGTIVEEVGFLHRIEDLKLFGFTRQALWALKQAGFLLIVVTNQSGVGRGFFSQQEVNKIHEKIQGELSGLIDAFYFCPHIPEEGCLCRKPALGMIEKALVDFPICLKDSWTVGDRTIDVELGMRAGTKTALVLTGYGERDLKKLYIKPDLVEENLLKVAERIISMDQKRLETTNSKC